MKIKALKGFKDIVPGEVCSGSTLNESPETSLIDFISEEIRLPILEETELFARSIGEATDIVEKEMYTFVDKQVTMRPEATASMVRAYIEHGLYVEKPVQRLFTIGPMFRHERPQKGRLRQFHQMDIEVSRLGKSSGRCRTDCHGCHAAGRVGYAGQSGNQFSWLSGMSTGVSG